MENMSKMKLNIYTSEYKLLTVDKNSFKRHLEEVVHTAIKIWIEIAKIADMPVRLVSLESIRKFAEIEAGVGEGDIVMPEKIKAPEGTVEIIKHYKKAWIVYVDFTNSTDYFTTSENYTGFVLFNAFIMLLKTYIRLFLSGIGEFIEHTGDGASFVIEATDNLLLSPHLLRLLYIAELMKKYSTKLNLMKIKLTHKKSFSLIHIGFSVGKGYKIAIGTEKKFVSRATWSAAKACQNAPRVYSPINPFICLPLDENGVFSEWHPVSAINTHKTSDLHLTINEGGVVEFKIKGIGSYELPIRIGV